MRVLLTGAGGFVGSHVARALVDRGLAVTAVVRPGGDLWRLASLASRLSIVAVDLADGDAFGRTVGTVAPDVVCDLAWQGVENGAHDDPRQLAANHRPRLAAVAAAAHAGCRRWIGVGSQAEYGPQRARIDETCPARPVTRYGRAKLAVGREGAAIARAAGMEFVWLRLFASYGPMDRPGWLIPSVTTALLRGERPRLTEGRQRWDYLFVEDAARAVVQTALAPRLDGVFNVGGGGAVPVRTVVETIRNAIDPRLPLGFGELPYRPGQPMHLEADITKLCAAISWRPSTALAEGLARTVGWYRDHGARHAA